MGILLLLNLTIAISFCYRTSRDLRIDVSAEGHTNFKLNLRLMPWKYSTLASLDDYKVTTTSVSPSDPNRFYAQWEHKFRIVVCTGATRRTWMTFRIARKILIVWVTIWSINPCIMPGPSNH
jgi:hypothetical protein